MSETPRPEASDAPDIVERLNAACVGHPDAKIPWPHRLLHEARDTIITLERDLNGWRKIVGDIAASVALPDIVRVTGTTKDLIEYFAALRAELAAVKRERDAMTLEKDQFRREAAFHFAKSCEYAEAREAAEAEVARLVAGLEPFAEAALNVKETTPGRFVHVTPNGTHNDLSFISLPPPPFLRARSLTAAKGG